MEIKTGVTVKGIQPETIFAIVVADSLFRQLNQKLVITSVTDGIHKIGSLHYEGYAFDLRIFGLKGIAAFEVRDRLQEALGSQYDVVLEPSHIHVEFDP